MELPESVRDVLRCVECNELLSCGPVFLVHETSAAICGRCSPQLQQQKQEQIKNSRTESEDNSGSGGRSRNLQYEALAKLHSFPCKFATEGCRELMSFSAAEPNIHERDCPFRTFICPINARGLSLGSGLVVFATLLSETFVEATSGKRSFFPVSTFGGPSSSNSGSGSGSGSSGGSGSSMPSAVSPGLLPMQLVYDYRYGWSFFTAIVAFILAEMAALMSISGYLRRFPTVEDMAYVFKTKTYSLSIYKLMCRFAKWSRELQLRESFVNTNV